MQVCGIVWGESFDGGQLPLFLLLCFMVDGECESTNASLPII